MGEASDGGVAAQNGAEGSTGLSALAAELRARHFGMRPLLLANVWDAASARAVAEAGYPVVGSSSAAVASSLGEGDHECMTPDAAFAAISRIAAAVPVPVTADIEAGYGLSPAEIAARLLDAGAVGCNLEDSDHAAPGGLLDADRQAERIHDLCQAAKASGVDLVVNARVDVYIRQAVPERTRAAEAIRRGRKYVAAGATCVYPIGLRDGDEIALLIRELKAPVNVWLRRDTPSIAELGRIGVARISVAAALHRATMIGTRQVADAILRGDTSELWERLD